MNRSVFTINVYKYFIGLAAVCFLFTSSADLFAQYKGAPVKKDRLLRALRSKQLQTGDIVTIINRNGVDFRLTEETKRSLIAAGARPEVIQAIANNSRVSTSDETIAKNKKSRKSSNARPDYDNLLEQAIYSYKEKKNSQDAIRFLQTAVKANPENPAAYQMLGYVYLYGLNDYAQAEKYMRESIENGGSAVFRVFHDDNGNFNRRCTGSLYVSQNALRFESDDNVHTFETQTVNVDKVKLDVESNKDWKKHSVFKVLFKFGKEDIKFKFSPLTGKQEESKIVERFIKESNQDKSAATAFSTAQKM